jgi:predicted porin
MKKLLSIAIAAVVAAPMAVMADTTVYGIVDLGLVNTDPDAGNDSWDIGDQNGSSRFGVKGSEDLGNGMKAVFQYEWSTNDDFGNGINTTAGAGLNARLAFVGLSSSWGTVAIGRQWNPYYFAVGKTDIMNAPSAGYRQNLNNYRTGNAVKYSTPKMGGFKASAVMVMDGDDAEEGIDKINLGLQYDNGPLHLGLGYRSTSSDINDSDTIGLGAKYNFGNFAVVAHYEDQDNGSSGDADSWGLGAEAYFGNNTVKALVTNKDTGSSDTDSWALGFQHSLSKRTRVYVEYADMDAGSSDWSEFAVGLRHDF